MCTVRPAVIALFPLCATLASADFASAQQPSAEGNGRRTMVAMRLLDGESVSMDGRLDEPAWQRATPAADFVQIDPSNGARPTEPTEVRIVFDSNAIYIGVTCFDSDPDGWLGFQRRRDEFIGSDDRFMWTIDTFLDARSGYFFETNPSGLMADSIFGVNGDNRQWDGIWDLRTSRSEIGWTIEVAIPFRTLNFDPNSDTWGINFQRTVRRKNEETIWTGWARNQGLRRMTNAGHVTGITNVTQGHGLDIRPYGLYISEASPGRGSQSMAGDAKGGIDLFYNPTPFIRANFTVNTDFAQTEVDQRQVNLTRYSLFFPERRQFFLDGAPFFDFGSPVDADLRVNPFFSRRIGLTSAGAPQTIDFGTKVTGQVGGQDIGLLHVRTGEDTTSASEDFTVARVKRRLLRQSYVGAVYTRRDPRVAGGETRQTSGLDAMLGTSSFLGSYNLESTAWFLHAPQPGIASGNAAFGGAVNYPNDRWNARFDATEVQENFDPGVGFVTRRSYRQYIPTATFAPRPADNRIVRQYTFKSTLDMQTDLDNDLFSRTLETTLLQVNFQSQENFAINAVRSYERLDAPFAISRGVTLPLGAEYTFTRFRVNGQTANRRMVSVNGRFETGGFYSGHRTERVLNLNVRLRPGFIIYTTGEWNSVDLPEGEFTTRLYRIVGEAQFTPFIALVNNIQYDSQSAVVGWQSRFRWIVSPGNDLYVVYTHNWLDEPLFDRFSTLDKRFASKILYTYRF